MEEQRVALVARPGTTYEWRAPFDPPDGELVVETASVDALDAGSNVARV